MPITYALISSVLISVFFLLTKSAEKNAHPPVISSLILSASTITIWIIAISKYGSPFSGVKGTWVLPAAIIGILAGLATVFLSSALKNTTAVSGESVFYLIPVLILVYAIVKNGNKLNYYVIAFILLTIVGISVLSFGKRIKSIIWIFSALISAILFAFAICYKEPDTKHKLCFICLVMTFALLISLIIMFITAVAGKSVKIKSAGVFISLLSGTSAALSYWIYLSKCSLKICTVIVCLNIIFTALLSLLFTKSKFSWKTACGLLLLSTGSIVYVFCPI